MTIPIRVALVMHQNTKQETRPSVRIGCDIDARVKVMKKIITKFQDIRVLRDLRGQDLIEYALMAGFVAVAAGALMPNVSSNVSTIFSKVGSSMSRAATNGS